MSKDRSTINVWERIDKNKRIIKNYEVPLYFYVENNKGEYTSIYDKKLSKCEFNDFSEFYRTKEDLKNRNVKLYESDISAEYKVLSENYYGSDINELNISFYDIETDYDPKIGYGTLDNPYGEINAISMYHKYSHRSVVITVPPKNDNWHINDVQKIADEANCELFLCKNEKELLLKFLDELENTDVIAGWNNHGYDDIYVYERLNRVLGKSYGDKLGFPFAKVPFYKEEYNEKFKQHEKRLHISGRVFLDYMKIFQKFLPGERESFSLESISNDELPELPKLEYEGSLYNLYNNNYSTFIKYNIRDTEILKGIESKFGFIELAIQLSHINTCAIKDVTGTVKLVEMAIINYCHYELDKKVTDGKERNGQSGEQFTGAFVLDTVAGLHRNLASVDVRSLYPSTMRAVNISPDTLIGQFYDKHRAYEEIVKKSDVNLTLLYENDVSETKKASEWYDYIKECNWTISGYGTIFDQSVIGIIPAILTKWFNERIEYKSLIEEYEKEIGEYSEDSIEYHKLSEKIKYYDRLQNIKKLSLNSTYGACGNAFFKFFDIRLAESTTRSGQAVLNHMIRTIASYIDGEYTYPSPSILFGDTDSTYFLTHATDVHEALLIAKSIQKVVNREFCKFIQLNFLASETKKDFIKVDQEIISDYGIAVAKKNYILHLNYKDGKPVDKIYIKGLQIKKSVIPKAIGKRLTKFVENLLKGKSIKEFAKELVDYRDEVKYSDILNIGRPKSVNNVQVYTEKFLKKEPKLRLPGHVSSAILWNHMMKENNDLESPEIVSGMKIKEYYLVKEILLNDRKFKSIALPSDLSKIPLWFSEKFVKLIDREEQVVKLIDGPFEKITNAIKEDLPTKNLLLIDEEFEY